MGFATRGDTCDSKEEIELINRTFKLNLHPVGGDGFEWSFFAYLFRYDQNFRYFGITLDINSVTFTKAAQNQFVTKRN